MTLVPVSNIPEVPDLYAVNERICRMRSTVCDRNMFRSSPRQTTIRAWAIVC